MAGTSAASLVETGIFDPRYASEAAIFAAWTGLVTIMYLSFLTKHHSGPPEWALLLLGVVMPTYALRYVLFGTRWGSNSSFAIVNLMFTSFCPARILLPCPDSNPVSCQLNYPKIRQASTGLPSYSADVSHPGNFSSSGFQPVLSLEASAFLDQHATLHSSCTLAPPNCSTVHSPSLYYQFNASIAVESSAEYDDLQLCDVAEKQDRQDLHFPVLVPLWQIYVHERPAPIYLHTTFMTMAALLWPLQLWKAFRQHNYALHRRLGYMAVAATGLGSMSAAPYAFTYLLSMQMPETITGLGYLGMYTCAARFLVAGIQAARQKQIVQHKMNMIRLVGLSWGVSPLGRILTVTPPIIWFPGPWNNATVVCLSWPLGIWIAQKCLHKAATQSQ